jgi:hypothetical protein
VKLVPEHIPQAEETYVEQEKDGHNEAHEEQQVWDAFYIVSNEINDRYLAVTLSVRALRNAQSGECIMKVPTWNNLSHIPWLQKY